MSDWEKTIVEAVGRLAPVDRDAIVGLVQAEAQASRRGRGFDRSKAPMTARFVEIANCAAKAGLDVEEELAKGMRGIARRARQVGLVEAKRDPDERRLRVALPSAEPVRFDEEMRLTCIVE